MSDALTLPAELRERAGKGASRELRRDGRVPAVIYGGKEEPLAIHVEAKELVRQLGTGHFMNSIVMVEVGGKKLRTLPKDVALHPVTDRPLHVDFLRLAKDAKIQVAVPVVFINEDDSPGLRKGGVLNVVRHDLELVCESDKIPDEIQLDDKGATPLALTIHELATNSAKYGALSVPEGQIAIDARLDGEDVTLVWNERGGPRIEAVPTAV